MTDHPIPPRPTATGASPFPWSDVLRDIERHCAPPFPWSDILRDIERHWSTHLNMIDMGIIGKRLDEVRAYYMALTWQGLTTTYNQLKDPDYAGKLSRAKAKRPASPDRGAPPWAMPRGLDIAVPAMRGDPDLLRPETRVAYIHHLRYLHEELDRIVLAAYGWSDVLVPPYCSRSDDPAAQAALSLFEDTVIDRLYALNAQRAAEEAAIGNR